MASLADIQRYLRQRRATGQSTSGAESRMAFEAFFDAQAGKNLQKGQLALQRRSLDVSEKQGLESLALQKGSAALQERAATESERRALAGEALTRDQIEAQEDAAKVQGITQLGQLAYLGSQTKLGGKALSGIKGLFGGGATAPTVGAETALAGGGTGSIGAQAATSQAVSSLAPTATGAASSPGFFAGTGAGSFSAPAATTAPATGGLGAIGVGGGIAAGAAIDDILSRKVAGTEDDPEASFAQKTRGITRYGGSSPLTTSLIEKGLGKGGREIVDKIIDPTGLLGKVEDKVGSVISKTIPKFLGGSGTWLCTKTKETVGMSDEEWDTIGEFRMYAYENHADWINFYVEIGPELVEEINGDNDFYKNLKETFLIPVIKLVEGGFMDAAYLTYKSACTQLVNKYKPSLMEASPKGA